jgi:hypothetical protein
MPKPYGLRGGHRAVFDDAVESTWTAGWDGRPTGTLTEYSEQDAREVDLPTIDTYAAVIDHVFDCLAGRATSRLAPPASLMVSGSPWRSEPHSPAVSTDRRAQRRGADATPTLPLACRSWSEGERSATPGRMSTCPRGSSSHGLVQPSQAERPKSRGRAARRFGMIDDSQ